MKIAFIYLTSFCFLGLMGCKPAAVKESVSFTKIAVDTLLTDKISIRAILIDDEELWYAGSQNQYGVINLDSKEHIQKRIALDTLRFEFRSIAKNEDNVFLANVGSPAYFFKINDDTLKEEVVYTETNSKAFYDSMNFWNNKEGIAMGDPTEDCLSLVITRNGGKTWNKVPCSQLPKIIDGEAAFAASNTNICIKGNSCWIVSGGKKSRVFYSSDKGVSWQVFETPIVQGEAMTGIFSADFYDEKIGFIAGGNYEKPNQNFLNKAITFDGGKTWKLVAENEGFGYASCVQFVPNSNGKALVCVGAKGLFYSNDFGNSWKQFSTDATLYTIRFINNHEAVAAGKDKIIRITFE